METPYTVHTHKYTQIYTFSHIHARSRVQITEYKLQICVYKSTHKFTHSHTSMQDQEYKLAKLN